MANSTPQKEALHIVEKMQKIGYPNPINVPDLTNLAKDLLKLAPNFRPVNQLTIRQLEKVVHKIEERLDKEGNIPTKMYAQLNRELVMLKTELQNAA